MTHTNKITDDYIEYIEEIDPVLISGISYTRAANMNILKLEGDTASQINSTLINFTSYPKTLDNDETGYIEGNYDLLAGEYPTDMTDLL